MKKLLVLLVSVLSVTVLMTSAAYAAPPPWSPTEPTPSFEPEPTPVPTEQGEETPEPTPAPTPEPTPAPTPEPVPTPEPEIEIEIPDDDVPLAEMPSPQTGVAGLSGMESVTLAAAALAAGGILALAKARKQTGSAR